MSAPEPVGLSAEEREALTSALELDLRNVSKRNPKDHLAATVEAILTARLAAVPASGGLAAAVGALAEEWPEPTEEGEGRLLARIRALLAAHLAADGATGQEGT